MGIEVGHINVGLVGYKNSGASWALFSICMDTNSWKKAFNIKAYKYAIM
jgi:hypothetical protein